ncbi:hypothetical protein Pth03_74300 [Planotetraspora thailandica]|uniref:Uncharacterized protein n=1 Tax=Planotetraspora thailandica TaxID=487172 RepID=A0A8J4DEP8_9ACTN|nr:hypothetical protein Pth03_74300 [Planotetraspora thailandica]
MLGGRLDYVFDRIRVLVCTLALTGGQFRATGQEVYLSRGTPAGRTRPRRRLRRDHRPRGRRRGLSSRDFTRTPALIETRAQASVVG